MIKTISFRKGATTKEIIKLLIRLECEYQDKELSLTWAEFLNFKLTERKTNEQ